MPTRPLRAATLPCLLATALVALLARPAAAEDRLVLYADRDDDDANGLPDADQPSVPPSPELHAVSHPKTAPAAATSTPSSFTLTGPFRLLADNTALHATSPIPLTTKRLSLQATTAGRGTLTLSSTRIPLSALEIRAIDGEGREVDLTRSHASLQRTPPTRLADDPYLNTADPDALRFLVIGVADDLPATLALSSLSPSGAPIDSVVDLALGEVPCPAGVPKDLTCGSTVPIRAVADDIDRNHPLVRARSIKAEVGGAIAVLSPSGEKAQMIRVAGPRRSALGRIDRFRATIRMFLLRLVPHGPPPIGGDDAGAVARGRLEIERASAMWGACGISFGPPALAEVKVVDPPPPHLLAIGCDQGFPASGGSIRVRVDGREVSTKVPAGARPAAAARLVAAAIGAAGFVARVSDNPVIGAGAFGSSDVLVRRKNGQLAALDAPAAGPVSSDATLTACVGRVDLEDGLQHFGDVDAIAGTVEERTLIKAFDDGDPATIEVFVVPSFAGGGRIGESFIAADGGSAKNLLFLDRAGVRADRASFALAHELGHILLDDPGHPDDFGVDTPTRLMDADAANPTAYGPRRITVDECVRAIRQSGPGAPVEVLRRWPLGRLGG